MVLIEGFGDEVILALAVVAVLTLLILAWIQRLAGRPDRVEQTEETQTVENNTESESSESNAESPITSEIKEDATNVSTESQPNVETVTEQQKAEVKTGESDIPDAVPSTSIESTPNVNATDVTADSSLQDDDDDGQIRIRLKYLDDRQKLVHAKPDDTVGDFKRKHFAREMAENLIVRFIYNGQELRQDGNTLQAYNVADNSVIHCLLSSRPQQETRHRQNTLIPEDWDAGFLMFPLFGLILVLTWYFRITYRTYFNAMSTFSLIGITFLYFIALLASLRTHDEDVIME